VVQARQDGRVRLPRRLVVGITGAEGATYAVRLLEVLRDTPVETHLVMCPCSRESLRAETGRDPADLRRLADRVYHPSNQAARISSGSFLTEGMIIAPCSATSLAAIATGLATTLIHRAADVMMKEGRRLALLVHESPLSAVHVENLRRLGRVSCVMAPSVTSFSDPPASLDRMVDRTVARLLDLFGIDHGLG
jgi:4-hydroxy-3-polyprenylbenzoate decarboxylase